MLALIDKVTTIVARQNALMTALQAAFHDTDILARILAHISVSVSCNAALSAQTAPRPTA